jgi:hypothetical protein
MTALARLRKWADEGNGTVTFIPDSGEPRCKWRIEVESHGQLQFKFGSGWLESVEAAAALIVDRLLQVGDISDAD